MAAARALLIGLVLLGFTLLAPPIHWLSRWSDSRPAAKAGRLFCQAMLLLLRVRVVQTGQPGARGRLVVANHVSWIDILVLGSREQLCFLAKHEVATWPMIASLARALRTVFVDRGRRRLLPHVNRVMAERLDQGLSVLLFPEGTTHDGRRRGRFLTSHLACLRDRLANRPGVTTCPVQAVTLTYSDPQAAWIGQDTLLPHLWRVLCRPPMVCRLVWGPVRLVTRGYDRKMLGRALGGDVDRVLQATGGIEDPLPAPMAAVVQG